MKKLLLLFTFISGVGMNAQAFWTEVANIFPDPTYFAGEISIVDANVIWINGRGSTSGYPNDNRKWAKSEDGGLTWLSGDYNMPVNTVVGSIKSTSATTAYATTYSPLNGQPGNNGINGVWKTTDSGTTWTRQNSAAFNSPSSFTNSIYFWNENEGVVVGDPVNNSFEIYTTTNGGSNWTPILTSNIPNPEANEYAYILNYDAKMNSIWFGTNYGRIFKSNNKGINWTVSQSPISDFGYPLSANFTFKNETEGLLTDSDFNQWRTLDGGNTWTSEIPTGVQRNYRTENVPQTSNTYFQFGKDLNLDQRGASYSTDGGLSWIDLNTDVDPVYPFSVKFQSGTVGFCIGYYINHPYENGVFQTKFFRLTDPLQRLANNSLATNNFDIKNKINLYPNPTNGLVKISGNEINEISIVDVIGKTVYSEKYNSLNEANINISNLNNGIYIATISSKDGSSSSQKIIKN
jgi:Secretion system C-terminal sorting domain